MSPEDVYRNRDTLLGEIHESTRNTEESLKTINLWCKEHDKKDDKRFMIGAVAILVIAVSAGVLPEIIKVLGF